MSKTTVQPGIFFVTNYFTLFAVNSLVIYLAHLLFPGAIVLGTAHISVLWALVLSMSAFSLLGAFIIPFINQYEHNRGKMLSPKDWMAVYFLVNFVGLWLVARGADVLGMGLSSYWVAVGLAIFLDISQGLTMMQLTEIRKKYR